MTVNDDIYRAYIYGLAAAPPWSWLSPAPLEGLSISETLQAHTHKQPIRSYSLM